MTAPPVTQLQLDFEGVTCRIRSDSAEVLTLLDFDLAAYRSSATESPDLQVTVQVGPALPARERNWRARWGTTRYRCFDRGRRRRVEYRQAGEVSCIVELDRDSNAAQVHAVTPRHAFERAYFLILSRIGELHELRGRHRVHGLALSCDDRALLFIGRQGGGKSTIGLSLLADERFRLISDDTPSVGNDGRLRPFHVRMAIKSARPPPFIPDAVCRRDANSVGSPRTFVDLTRLPGRLEVRALPVTHVFMLRYVGARNPGIRPAGRLSLTAALLRDCVLGLGVPQVAEFFVRLTLSDLFIKAAFMLGRLRAVSALLRSARPYRMQVCSDLERNRAVFIQFWHEAGTGITDHL